MTDRPLTPESEALLSSDTYDWGYHYLRSLVRGGRACSRHPFAAVIRSPS